MNKTDIIFSGQSNMEGRTEPLMSPLAAPGAFTNGVASRINPYAAVHYNNAAMTLLGTRAAGDLAAYASGERFEVEEEPYPEVAE